MKDKVFPLILFMALASCTTLRQSGKQKTLVKSSPPPQTTQRKSVPLKAKVQKGKQTLAVFHLLAPETVELHLSHVDGVTTEKVVVDKTLSKLEMIPGHWQLSGFSLGAKIYKVTNPSEQFIFKLKEGDSTYVGSYLIHCPTVGNESMSEIKKLGFFNRYYFSREDGPCEMVVGNSYGQVNRAWIRLDKKNKALKVGF